MAIELESLYVKITADFTNLISAQAPVVSAVDTMVASLMKFVPAAAAVDTAINGIVSSLTKLSTAAINATTSLAPVSAALAALPVINASPVERLARGLRAISLVNFTNLPSLTQLSSWLTSFSAIDPKAVSTLQRLGKGLADISRGLLALSIGRAGLKTAQDILNWAKQWASVSPIAINNLSVVGRALYRIGLLGGKGLPTINNTFNSIAGSSGRATTGIGRFIGTLQGLFTSANSANVGLTTLKLTLVGFIGFGVRTFALMDDALVTTMAHMRDWNQSTRGVLERGITNVAMNSSSSVTEMAKALDILTGSGMNAAMAVKALAISNDFAAASHLPLEEATRKLVDLQRSLGLESNNVEEHYARMTHLSDLFVASAQRSGSTVDQLTSAFSGRFITTMRMARISAEEGLAILRMYSETSPAYRGVHGGDVAGTAIQHLMYNNVQNKRIWDQMGVSIYNANGQMRSMVDIVGDLSGKYKGMTEQQIVATMTLQGIGPKVAAAIAPLITGTASERLKELVKELQNVDGIAALTANMMRKGFGEQMKILWGLVTMLSAEIGKALAPAITYLATSLGNAIRWFQQLNPAVRSLIVWTGIAIVGILAFVAALGTIITVGIFVFAGIGTALAFIWANLYIIIGVVAAFGAAIAVAFAVMGTRVKDVADIFKMMDWEGLARDAEAALVQIAGFFYNFGENLERIWKWVEENWDNLMDNLQKGFARFVANSISNMVVLFLGQFRLLGGVFEWIWDQLGNLLRDLGTIAGLSVKLIVNTISEAFSAIKDIVMVWGAYISKALANAFITGFNSFLATLPFAGRTFLARMGLTPTALIANPLPNTSKTGQEARERITRLVDTQIGEFRGVRFQTDLKPLFASMSRIAGLIASDLDTSFGWI